MITISLTDDEYRTLVSTLITVAGAEEETAKLYERKGVYSASVYHFMRAQELDKLYKTVVSPNYNIAGITF